MSQTQTNAISSETMVGDYGKASKKIETLADVTLPETMIKAIRIIERLLTQTKYHEQHVLYKNYPPVNLAIRTNADDDEEDEENKNRNRLKKFKKQEEEEEEKKEVEEEMKEGQVYLKKLFTFESAGLTVGR